MIYFRETSQVYVRVFIHYRHQNSVCNIMFTFIRFLSKQISMCDRYFHDITSYFTMIYIYKLVARLYAYNTGRLIDYENGFW